ncbi:MAG TPA: glycerophosphoryl diester phosphodiesterase membrane domain-containing protein [Alphaproteobacteria bacterium]|nr:glycerophosphoryl diester phosphodiesterase membrane domain-containing protein [Alphaproteobacteria bacterium]
MTDISAPILEPAGEFRIGRVLSRALTITSRNIVKIAIIVGVPFLPLLLVGASFAGPRPDLHRMAGPLIFSGIITILLAALSQVVVIHAAFQSMRGRPISIGESLSKGLVRFLPVIGLAIVMAFGIVIGFVLLVVPGFMLLTRWYLAIPACVVESAPVFGSLERSAQLTKGHRWQILGLYLVVAVVGGILNAIAGGIFRGIFGTVIGSLPAFVVQVIIGAYQAVVVVVAYHDLRSAKEGVDIDRIAAVFD